MGVCSPYQIAQPNGSRSKRTLCINHLVLFDEREHAAAACYDALCVRCVQAENDGLNTRSDTHQINDTENEQRAANKKKNTLPHGVMVAQLVLIQSVQVQISVG